jgi:cytochrome c oxidase subunit 1
LHLAGVSSIITSLNFTTTLNKKQADPASFKKPLFIWSIIITAILLILSMPILAKAFTVLLTDLNLNTRGGAESCINIYFDFFGHPEAYILILPGFGITSHASCYLHQKIQAFRIIGTVYAILSIGLLGLIV